MSEPLRTPQVPPVDSLVARAMGLLMEEMANCQWELDQPELEAMQATLEGAQTPSAQGLSVVAPVFVPGASARSTEQAEALVATGASVRGPRCRQIYLDRSFQTESGSWTSTGFFMGSFFRVMDLHRFYLRFLSRAKNLSPIFFKVFSESKKVAQRFHF